MSTRVFHTRLPELIAAQLSELCDLTQQSVSGVIRACVAHVLSDPELWHVVLASHTSTTVEDLRSDEQIQNWERDKALFTNVDLSPLLRMTLPT